MKSCWYYNQYTLLLFLLFTITNLPVTTITIYLFIYIIIAYLIYPSLLSFLSCELLENVKRLRGYIFLTVNQKQHFHFFVCTKLLNPIISFLLSPGTQGVNWACMIRAKDFLDMTSRGSSACFMYVSYAFWFACCVQREIPALKSHFYPCSFGQAVKVHSQAFKVLSWLFGHVAKRLD